MKRHFKKIGSAAALVAVSAVNAFATPVLDLTTAAASITAELTPAITSALPIAGTIIAVGLGWKMFKRFTK